MKIAVTYENGQVFQHFGHTAQFKIYEAQEGRVASSQVVDTNGSGHGALAGFLQAQGVDTLICGGIGGGAKTALAQAGIQLYGGVTGLKRTWERPPLGAAFFCALLPAHAWAVCSSSLPWKGSRGVAFPTQVRERRCMARVQATYSRFRSKSV